MPIGIASPQPSGIPGFSNSGVYLQAGIGGGAINARPLPSWFNTVTKVFNANDSMSLPPATCGGEPIWVFNYPDPVLAMANSLTVFGSTNPQGVQDTIADATGAQGTTGVAVPPNATAMFWAVKPQDGFTNAWTAGEWQFKILA